MSDMHFDIIVAGVGGQGILTAARLIAGAAMREGRQVKQAEIHGMAQRGGAVEAHLRIADRPLHGPVIGPGCADMILALEPLEALRHLSGLKPDGVIVSGTEPIRNIPEYGDIDAILDALWRRRRTTLIPASALAASAGDGRAASTVMVGAASAWLPVEVAQLRATIDAMFARKGARIRDLNLEAFELGAEAASRFREAINNGSDPATALASHVCRA